MICLVVGVEAALLIGVYAGLVSLIFWIRRRERRRADDVAKAFRRDVEKHNR